MRRKEFSAAVQMTADRVTEIEYGYRALRVSMAIAWAHALQCEPEIFVRAALQDQITAAGVPLVVRIERDDP